MGDIQFNFSGEATFDNGFNENFLQYVEEQVRNTPISDIKIPYFVQVRKHKKKRINKKWLKKYGYKCIYKMVKAKEIKTYADEYPFKGVMMNERLDI